MLEKGLVQIYTGNGKGKTTAALGQALRAAGQGNKVLIYQFLKPPSLDVGERFALNLSAIPVKLEALDEQWDMGKSFGDPATVAGMKAAIKEVLGKIAEAAAKKSYDVIILDEIVFCLSKDLADIEDVKNIINKKDDAVELILTGRSASEELIDLADLITEMKPIKHPFEKGVPARRGIEY